MLSCTKVCTYPWWFAQCPLHLGTLVSSWQLPVLTVTLSYPITSYRTAEFKTPSLTESLNLQGSFLSLLFFFIIFHSEQKGITEREENWSYCTYWLQSFGFVQEPSKFHHRMSMDWASEHICKSQGLGHLKVSDISLWGVCTFSYK